MECRAVLLFTLVILACVLSTVDSKPTQSTCDTQAAASLETVMNHSIPRRCKKGKMTWHYPMGSMILHFKPKIRKTRTVWVCVSADLSSFGMDISDITRKNVRQLPNFASADYSVCVPTVDGRVKLKWDALQVVNYMSAIAYTIVTVP